MVMHDARTADMADRIIGMEDGPIISSQLQQEGIGC